MIKLLEGSLRILSLAALLLIAGACTTTDLKLRNWQELPDAHYSIPPFATHLADFKIALDPGHGGNARLPGYKRGPTGKREAIMNLNVALLLKEFLEEAGAQVFLTRKDDQFVSLQERARLAEVAGCDFMISLHHNASNNPQTNYAAVFYHLTPDLSPASMDLARHIYFGLVEALRLPQILGDGLLSDRLLYPAGFGVLRQSKIPAILLESSFYSNLQEEKRLSDLRYNRREAYGIFLGLARWAAGGIPHAQKISPPDTTTEKRPVLEYKLRDGLAHRVRRTGVEAQVIRQSISARIDGRYVPVQIAVDKSSVTFKPDSTLHNGYHVVQVDLENMFKNHNLPRLDTLIVSAPVDSIHFDIPTPYLAADPGAQLPITLTLFDGDGETVWDSTRVFLSASRGTIWPQTMRLKLGKATAYFRSDSQMGLSYITAATANLRDTLLLSLAPPGFSWTLTGFVRDASARPISDSRITLGDSLQTMTDDNGFYFFLKPAVSVAELSANKGGYAGTSTSVNIDSLKSQIYDFKLNAILGGVLHDAVIILDPALDGDDRGTRFPDGTRVADANLRLVKMLADTLRWAGAIPVLVRDDDRGLSSQQRISFVNQIEEGWYLRFSYRAGSKDDSLHIETTIYPANKVAEQIAETLLDSFSHVRNSRGVVLQNTSVPEVTLTNKTAVDLVLTKKQLDNLRLDVENIFSAIVRYAREQPAALARDE